MRDMDGMLPLPCFAGERCRVERGGEGETPLSVITCALQRAPKECHCRYQGTRLIHVNAAPPGIF